MKVELAAIREIKNISITEHNARRWKMLTKTLKIS